jgi:hypothetical protein
VLGAKLVGPTMEIPAEMLYTMDIGTNGSLGEVAALQLLNHQLT